MALIELVEKQGEGDLVREMLAFAAERIMDAEVDVRTGATEGARTPMREVQRKGYRDRDWDTRTGRIALEIPKLGKGMPAAPFPASWNPAARPRRRSWRSAHCLSDQWRFDGSLQEACIHGVSTRSVDDPVRAMG